MHKYCTSSFNSLLATYNDYKLIKWANPFVLLKAIFVCVGMRGDVKKEILIIQEILET